MTAAVLEKAEEMVSLLRETEEYRLFRALSEKLAEQPELKQRVDRYRRNVFALQNRGSSAFAETDLLRAEFSDLQEDALAADFLEAEMRFCRLMQSVLDRICGGVEIEPPEMQ